MKDEYPGVKQDLYGAFVVRGIELACQAGLVATVIGDTWMSIKSFEALRLRLLNSHTFDSFVHMRDVSNHPDIFGANAAFVLSTVSSPSRQTPFIRLTQLGTERKDHDLRVALSKRTQDAGFHLASGADFATIPGSPIVYWLSEKMRESFRTGMPLHEVAQPCQGLATTNNARFTRWWWEISEKVLGIGLSRAEANNSAFRWFPYNKGGEFRKWYGNQGIVVNWQNDGKEIKEEIARKYPYLNGNVDWVAKNQDTYFSASVSWSKISSGAPAFRAYPGGFVYDVAGTSIFTPTGRERAGLLSFANSQVALEQLVAIAPTLNYEVGQVAKLPITDLGASHFEGASLAEKATATAKSDWNSFETSWDFASNPLVELTQE